MNLTATPTFQRVPGNRAMVLRNTTCIYCGKTLDARTRTKEHVIARNFVPKGTLNAAWNLIAFCCGPCNTAKSGLEDDISAIVLQPNAFGELAHDDPRLASEAARKGRGSFDRDTRKPIQDSKPSLSVKLAATPGLDMGMSFTAPPQLKTARAAVLAWHHITAFCYLTTFNRTTLQGQFCQGDFTVLNCAPRTDWGNEPQLDFVRITAAWPRCLHSSTADGYFKVIIRRHSERCRSWALEWNRNFRIVGFMGNSELIEQLTHDLRQPLYHDLPPTAPGEQLRYREERPLADGDDILFRWQDEHRENRELPDGKPPRVKFRSYARVSTPTWKMRAPPQVSRQGWKASSKLLLML